MGLHQLFDGTTPHILISTGEDPIPLPPNMLDPNREQPPWLDITFLSRLDALNAVPSIIDDQRLPAPNAADTTIAESVSSFAHDVRTPLATIHATLELLSDHRPIDPDDLQQLVDRLQRGVTWITEMVENLSAVTESPDNDTSLEMEPTDVLDWLEHAIALVQPIAERRRQSILLACPRPSPVVCGDAFRLGQVIVNLLTNACRYGAWEDTIAVSVSTDGAFVSIRVSDHGMGILPDERERIFERHARGTQTSERVIDGQGLGLHIVRDIIKRHHGSVSVESVVGQGSTFCVRLPAARVNRPVILRHTVFEGSEAAE